MSGWTQGGRVRMSKGGTREPTGTQQPNLTQSEQKAKDAENNIRLLRSRLTRAKRGKNSYQPWLKGHLKEVQH